MKMSAFWISNKFALNLNTFVCPIWTRTTRANLISVRTWTTNWTSFCLQEICFSCFLHDLLSVLISKELQKKHVLLFFSENCWVQMCYLHMLLNTSVLIAKSKKKNILKGQKGLGFVFFLWEPVSFRVQNVLCNWTINQLSLQMSFWMGMMCVYSTFHCSKHWLLLSAPFLNGWLILCLLINVKTKKYWVVLANTCWAFV